MLSSNKVTVNVKMMCVFGTSFRIVDPFQPSNSLMNKYNYLRFKLKVVGDPCQKITLLLLKSKSVRVIVPESCF